MLSRLEQQIDSQAEEKRIRADRLARAFDEVGESVPSDFVWERDRVVMVALRSHGCGEEEQDEAEES